MKYSEQIHKIDLNAVGEQLRRAPEDVVLAAEERYHERVDAVSRACVERGARVILLCGPSAAGKTTSSVRLQARLRSMGRGVNRISLDNFYFPRDRMPRWEDGAVNYESIECLDIGLFTRLAGELLERGTAVFPVFDFKAGGQTRSFTLRHGEGDVLVVEGLHALNPMVAESFHGLECLRVYISTHTDFCSAGDVLLPAKLLRLCRRMLRDVRHRNTDVNATMRMWKYIRMGEERYIHPFRDGADFKIDTAHCYEPFLYGRAITESLESAAIDDDNRPLAETLYRCCGSLPALSEALIPKTSLIQEFIN